MLMLWTIYDRLQTVTRRIVRRVRPRLEELEPRLTPDGRGRGHGAVGNYFSDPN
jgi:hypothetical protein